ncbi:hypothetical protein HPB50_028356 [Hyalomma asiaticum]|nr:hypothetical protein HPB50_028356 [Hyalomma asiaticum]
MEEPSPAVRGLPVPENQREMLLAFLEQYPSLAQRSFTATPYFTAADRRRLWREISEALNAEGPTQKTSEQWQLLLQEYGEWAAPGLPGPYFASVRPLQVHGQPPPRLPNPVPEQQLPDVAAAVEVATMPAPRPPQQPVRRPRPPRPRRADVLGEMAAQCSRTLDQGINMLAVGGPLHIRKFRA